MNSMLDNRDFMLCVISVLVNKLGGEVCLTQADFDSVAYTRLYEGCEPPDWHVTFRLEKGGLSS